MISTLMKVFIAPAVGLLLAAVPVLAGSYTFNGTAGFDDWQTNAGGGILNAGGVDDGPCLMIEFPQAFAEAAFAKLTQPTFGRDFEIAFKFRQSDTRIRVDIGKFSLSHDHTWDMAEEIYPGGHLPLGTAPVVPDEWNEFRIVSRAGVVDVTLNDKPVLSGVDVSSLLDESGNTLGISSWGGDKKETFIDDVAVTTP